MASLRDAIKTGESALALCPAAYRADPRTDPKSLSAAAKTDKTEGSGFVKPFSRQTVSSCGWVPQGIAGFFDTSGLTPTCINQHPWAHFLCPMEMIFHGCSTRLFQAWQDKATISSYDLETRLESQLSRMNCHMFSTGFSSGDLGGKGTSVMLGGITSLPVVCHPAWSRMRTP